MASSSNTNTLLWRQTKHEHLSQRVWNNGRDAGVLIKPLTTTPWKLDPRVVPLVEEAGFGEIRKIERIVLDHALLSAMAERWRRETHTFHMPVGEMTVTLRDVSMILGLPIRGQVVTDPEGANFDFQEICQHLFGVVPEPDSNGRNVILVNWLKTTFGTTKPRVGAEPEELRHFATAYILYVIGTFLFPSGKQNTVPTIYLPLLRDIKGISRYSWGSATLSYLYSGLCQVCEGKISTLKGCGLLLQLWCWDYLHTRPRVLVNPVLEGYGPASRYWNGSKTWAESCGRTLRIYRDDLDLQEPNQVNWTPYENDRINFVSETCLQWREVYLCVVPLIHFNNVEWYRPDRVLRQFGLVQDIPEPIDQEQDKYHTTFDRVGRSTENWSIKYESEIRRWTNASHYLLTGLSQGHGCTPEYEKWYRENSRLFIAPPFARNLADEEGQGYHPRGSQLNKLIQASIDGAYRVCEPGVTMNDMKAHMRQMLVYSGEQGLIDRIPGLNITEEEPEAEETRRPSRRRRGNRN